jgi:N-acylneuraminate cytidylyltransferase
LKVLAVIPARGGSKGIPGKNIRMLAGKPLIAWTIRAAMDSGVVDQIVVSTDDKEIGEIALAWGAEVPGLRPAALAQDETGSMDVVLHLAAQIDAFDWLLLLQPTSPLRSADDIRGIMNLVFERGAHSAVSLCESSSSPVWMYNIDKYDRLRSVLPFGNHVHRRQELSPAYQLNGAMYLMKREWLLTNKNFIGSDTIGYLMPPERSADIDTPLDWEWVEFLLGKQHG